jgi:hypothetical protein
MTTLVLEEAELLVELNRLIHAALDTRKKLLACSLRAGSQAIGFIARNTALALSMAASELAELVRRLGGAPSQVASTADAGGRSAELAEEDDLLGACEQAIAEVACLYRDALEWNLPEPAQEVVMRQFGIVIANYEHLTNLRARRKELQAAQSGRRISRYRA